MSRGPCTTRARRPSSSSAPNPCSRRWPRRRWGQTQRPRSCRPCARAARRGLRSQRRSPPPTHRGRRSIGSASSRGRARGACPCRPTRSSTSASGSAPRSPTPDGRGSCCGPAGWRRRSPRRAPRPRSSCCAPRFPRPRPPRTPRAWPPSGRSQPCRASSPTPTGSALAWSSSPRARSPPARASRPTRPPRRCGASCAPRPPSTPGVSRWSTPTARTPPRPPSPPPSLRARMSRRRRCERGARSSLGSRPWTPPTEERARPPSTPSARSWSAARWAGSARRSPVTSPRATASAGCCCSAAGARRRRARPS